jgi:hypothetical protein
MPLKNLKKIITTDTLKGYVSVLLQRNSRMSVSDMMKEVLLFVSTFSRETVCPPNGHTAQKNTSSDDVTLLCLEIEHQEHDDAIVLTPLNINDISECIEELSSKIVHMH